MVSERKGLFEASIKKKKRRRITVDEKEITINEPLFLFGVLLTLMTKKYYLYGYLLEEVVWKQRHFSRE